MNNDQDSFIKSMKAEPESEEPQIFLMVNGEKMEDPKEIVSYVKENLMGEEVPEGKSEQDLMSDPEMRQKALEGLNLD